MVYVYPDGTVTYLAPPDGYVVDFANPTKQYVLALYLAIGILGSITLGLTFIRSYIRYVVQRKFSWEDGKMRGARPLVRSEVLETQANFKSLCK